MAVRATILGLDTAAGAYLARLLGARGYTVGGTGGADLLARLGIAGDVVVADAVAAAVADADEVYDLRGDPAATRADLLARLPAARLPAARLPGARLFVAVDPGDAGLIADLAAARAGGRFVATGRVHANESRFGPGTSPVARLVAAAAAGTAFAPADLAATTDCGWTPEYVDAMWRMLQRPAPDDLAIASGVALAGGDVARVAAGYFRRTPPAAAAPLTAPALPAAPADPHPAQRALGWRAVTVGDDLVTVLCDGVAGG